MTQRWESVIVAALMHRSFLFLLPFFSCFAATLVTANVVPVVQTQIADQTIYAGATSKINLTNAFSDPDMKAVRFATVLGNIDVQLFSAQKPITVTNFLKYVDQGRYFKIDPTTHHRASNFIHRSVSNFIIQGGGWIGTLNPADPIHIKPTQVVEFPAIQDEIGISNRRGMIAMAKSGPNTATSQWFINLADNGGPPHNLDSPTNNGGYTVFGQVIRNGMTAVDSIAALTTYNFNPPFDTLPLRNYNPNTQDLALSHLITIPDVIQIPPFNFSATTSNATVATVAIDPDQRRLVITAKQMGSAIITVKATDFDGAFVTQQFNVTVVASPGRLLNISTRMQVQPDPNELIAGFIVTGTSPKRVLIRAVGPSLPPSQVTNPLADPTLELHDTTTLLATNDDWGDSINRQEIEDTDTAPTSSSEATIVATLPPPPMGHPPYTAIMRGIGGNGVGLVEIYDLDSGPDARLANISSRGIVQTGEDVMIGGFIIGGAGSTQVAVRALGPSLPNDITNRLRDPFLELRNAQGVKIAQNDNWETAPNASDIDTAGVAPTNPLESTILTTQTPGRYTAIVSGKGSTPTGVGLVEVYYVQ